MADTLKERLTRVLYGNDPVLLSIQSHIDRLRERDRTLGWDVEAGRFRLVRTTYNAAGLGTVTALTLPLAKDRFLVTVAAM